MFPSVSRCWVGFTVIDIDLYINLALRFFRDRVNENQVLEQCLEIFKKRKRPSFAVTQNLVPSFWCNSKFYVLCPHRVKYPVK